MGRKRKAEGAMPQAHGRVPPDTQAEIRRLALLNGMREGTLTGHLILAGLASLHSHGDSVKALLEAAPRAPGVSTRRPFHPKDRAS